MTVDHNYEWEVFISHNRQQKDWVRQLVAQWRGLGLRVFFDEDSIDPGEPIDDGIERGVIGSRHIILVITPSAVASRWVALETSLAIITDPDGQNGRIIPVVLEPTPRNKIKLVIQRLHWIDLTSSQTRRERYHRLLEFLGIKESSLPSPPPWRPEPFGRTEQEIDPFYIRREFRISLTDLMCQYYEDRSQGKDILVAPQGMPILSHRDFLPEKAIRMHEIDKALLWDENMPPFSSAISKPDMVTLLKGQSYSPELYNGPLYRFLGMTKDKRFQFCLGSYYSFLNTCEFLSYELANAITNHKFAYDIVTQRKRNEFQKVSSFLLQNDAIIPARAANDPIEFGARETAFGTCALVVVRRSKKNAQMVSNSRSYELSETPGLLHVIPAGTFQANMKDDRFHDVEFSFTENLWREFTEELLEDKDLRGNAPFVLNVEDMYSDKGKRLRQIIINPERFELLYLGTVIDPINLKAEALGVLLLHEGYLQYVCGGELTATWETGRLALFDFTEANLDKLIKDESFVPTGKAHLMLVKKHYQYLAATLTHL